MGMSPQFVATPRTVAAAITDAETTTKVTVFTPGADGSKIEAIAIMSTNSASTVLTLWLTISAVDYPIAQLTLAAAPSGGYATSTVDPDTIGWLAPGTVGMPPLQSTAVLKASVGTTLAAGKTLSLVVFGGDY